MDKKIASQRYALVFRLRKKGITVINKDRAILYPYGQDPWSIAEIRRLCSRHGYSVQAIIT